MGKTRIISERLYLQKLVFASNFKQALKGHNELMGGVKMEDLEITQAIT